MAYVRNLVPLLVATVALLWPLLAYAATWFPQSVKCSGKDCVQVRIFQNTNLLALKERLATEVGEPAAGLFDNLGDVASPDGFESSTEIDRLVDPSTLLTQYETQRRTVTQQVPIPEQSSGVFTIEETRK